MIAVSNIEAVKPSQPASQRGGRAQRHDNGGARIQNALPTGREVATQRDAFYLRSQAILLQNSPATAPYLAQQISQLWPTPPAAAPKAAAHAYAQNGLSYDGEDHGQSVLA